MIKKSFVYLGQTISYSKKSFIADADGEFFLHADNLADLLAGLEDVETAYRVGAPPPGWLMETADRINIVPVGTAKMPSDCVQEQGSIYDFVFRRDPGDHSDEPLWYVNFPKNLRAFTRLDRAIAWVNMALSGNVARADREHLRQINFIETGAGPIGF